VLCSYANVMPAPGAPGTNTFHCQFCGREFNTEAEFHRHELECSAAKGTGSGDRTVGAESEKEKNKPDREWFSTP